MKYLMGLVLTMSLFACGRNDLSASPSDAPTDSGQCTPGPTPTPATMDATAFCAGMGGGIGGAVQTYYVINGWPYTVIGANETQQIVPLLVGNHSTNDGRACTYHVSADGTVS